LVLYPAKLNFVDTSQRKSPTKAYSKNFILSNRIAWFKY